MNKTTRDNILYVIIALAIVCVGGLNIWYYVSRGLPVRIPISTKHFAVFLTTAIVFGYVIQKWRRSWKNARFWVVLILLAAIYVALQWLVIQYVPVNIATVTSAAILGLFAVLFILDKLIPREYDRG